MAVQQMMKNLDEMAVKITSKEEVRNIALVSSNQDESIANIITDIYEKVGLNGAISIQQGEGYTRESQVEYVQGLQFDAGFLSPYFADDRTKINYGS